MPTGRDGYQPGFRTEERESGLVAVVGRGGGIELPGVVRLFDDFLGDTLDANLYSSQADAGGTAAAINVQQGGACRLVTSSTNNHRTDVAGEIIWKPSNGGLVFEARVKVDAITNVAIFVGLSDAKGEATTLLPFSLSGTTLTSTASDGVGWLFDTAATNQKWHGVGVKADVDVTALNSNVAPTAATFDVLRVEIDAGGNANYWLNSAHYGYRANACTPGTLLVPVIGVQNRTTSARNLEIDYLYCSMNRV